MNVTFNPKDFAMFRTLPIFAAILAVLSFAPLSANATDGFASGADLKQWCDNMDMDDIHWGLCVGSITAAHDIIMTYQASGAANDLVCTQMAHTRGDVVFAVMEYMKEHPESLEYSLGDAVLSAMIDKFPCP